MLPALTFGSSATQNEYSMHRQPSFDSLFIPFFINKEILVDKNLKTVVAERQIKIHLLGV